MVSLRWCRRTAASPPEEGLRTVKEQLRDLQQAMAGLRARLSLPAEGAAPQEEPPPVDLSTSDRWAVQKGEAPARLEKEAEAAEPEMEQTLEAQPAGGGRAVAEKMKFLALAFVSFGLLAALSATGDQPDAGKRRPRSAG